MHVRRCCLVKGRKLIDGPVEMVLQQDWQLEHRFFWLAEFLRLGTVSARYCTDLCWKRTRHGCEHAWRCCQDSGRICHRPLPCAQGPLYARSSWAAKCCHLRAPHRHWRMQCRPPLHAGIGGECWWMLGASRLHLHLHACLSHSKIACTFIR